MGSVLYMVRSHNVLDVPAFHSIHTTAPNCHWPLLQVQCPHPLMYVEIKYRHI